MKMERILVVCLAIVAGLAVLSTAAGCAAAGKQTTAASAATSAISSTPSTGQFPHGGGFLLPVLGMELDTITSALQLEVDRGTLTQLQAGEVREWWHQKPDFLTATLFARGTTGVPRATPSAPPTLPGVPQRPGGFGLGALAVSLDTLNTSLNSAVQEGTLSQEQASRTGDWWQQKPSFLNEALFPTGTPRTLPPSTRPVP